MQMKQFLNPIDLSHATKVVNKRLPADQNMFFHPSADDNSVIELFVNDSDTEAALRQYAMSRFLGFKGAKEELTSRLDFLLDQAGQYWEDTRAEREGEAKQEQIAEIYGDSGVA